MRSTLNLRRNPRTKQLVGVLIMAIASLMLINADSGAEQIVFGSLLLIGGFAMTAWFDRLVIDLATGELEHRRGFLLPLRSSHYPLRRIRGVRLSVAVVGRGRNRTTRYVVGLSGIRASRVSSHGNPWFSRVLAEQLARRIRVPLVNRVYGKSTRREPADLDRPLIERWRRDGVRFEAPRMPQDSRLHESADPDRYRLSIPAQMPALKFASLGLLLLAIGVGSRR